MNILNTQIASNAHLLPVPFSNRPRRFGSKISAAKATAHASKLHVSSGDTDSSAERPVANPSSIAAKARKLAVGAIGIGMSLCLHLGSSHAADFVKVGECLVGNCPVQLAQCVADPTCAENIACLQNCNGRADESECQSGLNSVQIRCGDLYASPAVEAFTKCAVSQKGCVPQRKDDQAYPVPPDRDLVANFDLSKFQGQWNITAGLNPLFDTFDCQKHNFRLEGGPNDLHADIRWRVNKNGGDFIERNAVQTFHQSTDKPGYLRNDNNDFLNYTDDWYILGWKPDAYAVIYYRGNNDAWQGYGGLTVYSRDLSFPKEYESEIREALDKIKLNEGELRFVDNSCPPHPDLSTFSKLEGAVEDLSPGEASTAAPGIDMRG